MEEVIQYVPNLYATFWALIPPLVAIILALITKEVYSSLFVGIVIGGLFYGNIFQSGFSFEKSVLHIFEGGRAGRTYNKSFKRIQCRNTGVPCCTGNHGVHDE